MFILTVPLVYSQNAINTDWVTPSYDNYYAITPELKNSESKISEIGMNASEEFTPAGDYYNSLSGLNVIRFTLSKAGFVNIKIYDNHGNTIDELARSTFGEGEHEVKWNSSKFKNGSFYYSIITNEYSKTNKIK
jgi:hypothetical protein